MGSLTHRLRSVFGSAFDSIRKGELRTLIPFLSLFRLSGKPMSLRMHYQFSPMFGTVQPVHSVYMCGRQLGKSYSICSSMLLRSMLVPYYHTLIVQPRADQIQRLIGTVYRPLMNSCPIRSEFISSTELQKLALREFNNGSLCYADYCFLSPDRLRGCSGLSSVTIDECQDVEYDFIPVIAETMSASLFWGFSIYTGTPKTTDTTLALLWERSSKAEWVISCDHCNYFNIPNPEHDLVKMIGKAGPVCAKCGKPIDISHGGYVHAIPDRMQRFPGYHISQTVHPLHSINLTKWGRLLEKVDTYSELTLYNEVFGWPYDAATSPLTLSDLLNTRHEIKVEGPDDVKAMKKAGRYRYVTVCCDWSGGGMLSDSYTAYAVIGLQSSSDIVDILHARRMPKGMTPTQEADELMHWISNCGADAFAFDNGGAGFARLEIMKHCGLMSVPDLTVVPMNYVAPRSGDVVKPHTGMREPDMYYYTLDKSRSLAVCLMAIKSRRIRFPMFAEDDETAVVRDFLALREDPRESLRGETVVLIGKKPGVPDDFAHAVNMGCSQLWDHFGAYPRIGSRYDTSALEPEPGEEMPDEDFGPRGDFDRFREALDMRATVMSPDLSAW